MGRDVELGVVQQVLADGLDGPAALVLAGEPGTGKTILWEAGMAEAARRYGHVLTCRGVEAEATLSFAGLSELLTAVLPGTPGLAAPSPATRASYFDLKN